jgi:hypothetical protein
VKLVPAECLTPSWLPDPSAGLDFPGVPGPFNGIPATSPIMRRVSPRLGSALRFSQPLSGFPATRSFVALFHATAVPGILPSEPFPRKERAPLSRPLLPCSYPLPCGNAPPEILSLKVSPTPTPSRSCLAPPPTMESLSTNKRSLPGLPGSRTMKPLPSASFTCFEVFFPLRIRSHQLELLRPGGRCSPGFPPLQSLLSYHASSSQPARARRLAHASSPERSDARPKGPCDPLRRVRPSLHRNTEKTSSTVPGPLRDRTAPPLGGASSPSALVTPEQARTFPDPRSLEVRGKRRFSEKTACSPGVFASSATS